MVVEDDKEEKPVNACCQKWKQKLLKAENGRRMLREAIRLLENGIEKIQAENDTLKKECEKERTKIEAESKRIEEEKRLRVELEKERNSLKVELASVLQRLHNFEDQSKIQKDREEHAESKRRNAIEEKRLGELLQKEQQRADAERKNAEDAKKCAVAEQRKAGEEKKWADAERKRADEENRLRVELEKERNFLKVELASVVQRLHNFDGHKKIQKDKEECADTERGNTIEEKRLRELLQKEKQRADAERKKMEEAKRRADAEHRKAEEEKKRADAERKNAEAERRFAESERRNLEEERRRADSEMQKAEDEKRARELVEKELQQMLLERKRKEESNICQEAKDNGTALQEHADRKKQDREKRLKEKLRKEHQQLKAEKERAEEERRQRQVLEGERSSLKQELACASRRLITLEAQLRAAEGEVEQLQMEAGVVDDSLMHRVAFGQSKKSCKIMAAQPSRRAKVPSHNQTQGNAVANSNMLTKASVSGGNFIENIPGISSILEPSIGGSVERKVQSSGSHCSITSFSDRKLVGSQGRDEINASNSSEVEKNKRKREEDIPVRSLTAHKRVCTETLALSEGQGILGDVTDQSEKKSFVGKQGTALKKLARNAQATHPYEQASDVPRKRCGVGRVRECESNRLVDSITHLFHKQKKAHLMIEKKLVALSETLRFEQSSSFDVLPPMLRKVKSPCKKKPNTATKLQKKTNVKENVQCKELQRKTCKEHGSRKKDWLSNCVEVKGHNRGEEHAGVREICGLIENGASSDQVREPRDCGISNLIEVVETDQEDGIFPKCMIDIDGKKMLELENESDEERYLQAKQSLLSPTLPDISSPLEYDNFDPLVENVPGKLIEPFTRTCFSGMLQMNRSLLDQDFDCKKIFEMENYQDEEAYLQAKQSLLSPTLPEVPFQILEQLERGCLDPSLARFISTDGGIDASETNKTVSIPDFCDEMGNLEDSKQYESAGQHMDEGDVLPQPSPHGALDVENIGSCRGKKSIDWLNKNNSIFTDATGFKSTPFFNKQTGSRSSLNPEKYLTETYGVHANEVAESNIDQVKECGDERWGGFLESDLEQIKVETKKDEDESSKQIADSDENVGSYDGVTKKCEDKSPQRIQDDDENVGSHGNCFPSKGNSFSSVDHIVMATASQQLGFEKHVAAAENVKCGQSSIKHRKESTIEFEEKNQSGLSASRLEQVKEVSEICEGQRQRRFSGFSIIASYLGDANTLSNMLSNIQRYLGEDLDVSWRGIDLDRLVVALASETKLLREDIVCIFISVLMSSLAAVEARNGTSSMFSPDHSSLLSCKHLITEIDKVSSKHETKGAFLKVCAFDILLGLMTKFLAEGKVEVYVPLSNQQEDCCNLNGQLVKVEHGQFLVFPRIATVTELWAGSNILAAFCLALGHVDCLYEVAYNLLRWCKKDSFWLLTVVHSFAFLCENKFFQVSRNCLLCNTMHYIILLLEGRDKGVRRNWQNHEFFTSVQRQVFPLCTCCPFAEDELSMNMVISSLLERLHWFHFSGILDEKTPTTAFCCENSNFIAEVERKVEKKNVNCSHDHFYALALSPKNLEEDMLKCGYQSNSQIAFSNRHLSNLHDTVRALELIAQYLGWDWTYNELIPHLWEMAQAHAPEVVRAAIFLLLGNLGRFGVDYDGFEQRGIEELRCNFSTFLHLHCTMKAGEKFPFSSQLAVAQALFQLISVRMKMLAPDQTESVLGITYEETLTSKHLQILGKWYSKLSTEQQSMTPEYLRAAISSLKN